MKRWTGLRGRRPGISLLSIGLITLLLISLTGCTSRAGGGSSSTSSTASDTTSSNAAAVKVASDANALGTALESALVRPTYFAEEPRGDLGEFDAGSPGVFARIVSVSTSGTVEISFDVEQFYQGRFATAEAAKDGVKRLEGDWYTRNRYHHVQTLPLADDAAVLLISQENSAKLYGRFPDPGESHEVVSPAVFANRFAAHTLSTPPYAWIETESGKIVLIIEQFFP